MIQFQQMYNEHIEWGGGLNEAWRHLVGIGAFLSSIQVDVEYWWLGSRSNEQRSTRVFRAMDQRGIPGYKSHSSFLSSDYVVGKRVCAIKAQGYHKVLVVLNMDKQDISLRRDLC